jgi:hypothetical protein
MSSPAVVQLRSRVPRIAGAAVERARLTVVPRRRTRAARMPFVALVSLVLLGGVVGLLLFNTSLQQASFAATSLEEQARTLSAREQTLQMQLDVLRDPQHVAAAAQAQGMVLPCQPAFLRLADGKVLGEPCVATATTRLRLQPLPPVKPRVLNPPPLVVQADSPADTGLGSRGAAGASGTDVTHDGRPATRAAR